MTSGAIQWGVPMYVLRLDMVLVSCAATPKSASLTCIRHPLGHFLASSTLEHADAPVCSLLAPWPAALSHTIRGADSQRQRRQPVVPAAGTLIFPDAWHPQGTRMRLGFAHTEPLNPKPRFAGSGDGTGAGLLPPAPHPSAGCVRTWPDSVSRTFPHLMSRCTCSRAACQAHGPCWPQRASAGHRAGCSLLCVAAPAQQAVL